MTIIIMSLNGDIDEPGVLRVEHDDADADDFVLMFVMMRMTMRQ